MSASTWLANHFPNTASVGADVRPSVSSFTSGLGCSSRNVCEQRRPAGARIESEPDTFGHWRGGQVRQTWTTPRWGRHRCVPGFSSAQVIAQRVSIGLHGAMGVACGESQRLSGCRCDTPIWPDIWVYQPYMWTFAAMLVGFESPRPSRLRSACVRTN